MNEWLKLVISQMHCKSQRPHSVSALAGPARHVIGVCAQIICSQTRGILCMQPDHLKEGRSLQTLISMIC